MFTLESFCNLVWGASYSKVLQKITKDDYKEFEIPKKGGTRRINYLPGYSELRDAQCSLLEHYLSKQNLPVCVKGFRKGESYKAFLSEHVGATFFLRVDIASFFPSIGESSVKEELSSLLACDTAEDTDRLLNLICDMVTLDGKLPQGACTSPAISNLIMARIDQRITKYCQVFHIRYTRYADDLLFSSDTFCFSEKKWFIRKIKYILSSQNLKLNYSKMKFGQNELILNGYVISDQGIRLSRNRLSDIRRVITFVKDHYQLAKSVPEDFLSEANKLPLKHRNLCAYPFQTVFQLSQYMCGYRAFLISLVDLNYGKMPFQKELQRLIRRIEEQIINLT